MHCLCPLKLQLSQGTCNLIDGEVNKVFGFSECRMWGYIRAWSHADFGMPVGYLPGDRAGRDFEWEIRDHRAYCARLSRNLLSAFMYSVCSCNNYGGVMRDYAIVLQDCGSFGGQFWLEWVRHVLFDDWTMCSNFKELWLDAHPQKWHGLFHRNSV